MSSLAQMTSVGNLMLGRSTVLAVMDHLKIERAHLVGHSTGGAIGQTLAAKYPDRLISLTV
jgi:pimeloyl-ACP methyl ester carboxylesterase